ncbi:penicillin-binding transpeptidase domain-containing protein [Algivirga pacifica]|uniref:Penicillin-binding protein transpeptidase domain-containing protein n=1 Tax=Algivirga pacifica TaxID=1162670 RepID=A0ABP9D4G8_9BACT
MYYICLFNEEYTLHSKTGWGNNTDWNVGYIETSDTVWVFALNMDMRDAKVAPLRKSIIYEILREEGIIE